MNVRAIDGGILEEDHGGRRCIELLKNGFQMDDVVSCVVSRLSKPRTVYLLSLKSGKATSIVGEKIHESELYGNIIEEKYIEGKTITSTFIFGEKTVGTKSPLLVWFSDNPNFDLHNLMLDELLKRDFVILFVKAKNSNEMNFKLLADEFYGLSIKLSKSGFSEMPILFSEGPRAGFASLNTHMNNLGIYSGAVFLDPISDILDLHITQPEVSFGFNPVGSLPSTDAVYLYSPYHSDNMKYLRNTLFLSSTHEAGFDSFKMYSLAKHQIGPTSCVYWDMLEGNRGADTTTILTFIWKCVKNVMKDVRDSEKEKQTKERLLKRDLEFRDKVNKFMQKG